MGLIKGNYINFKLFYGKLEKKVNEYYSFIYF